MPTLCLPAARQLKWSAWTLPPHSMHSDRWPRPYTCAALQRRRVRQALAMLHETKNMLQRETVTHIRNMAWGAKEESQVETIQRTPQHEIRIVQIQGCQNLLQKNWQHCTMNPCTMESAEVFWPSSDGTHIYPTILGAACPGRASTKGWRQGHNCFCFRPV